MTFVFCLNKARAGHINISVGIAFQVITQEYFTDLREVWYLNNGIYKSDDYMLLHVVDSLPVSFMLHTTIF